MLPAIRLGFLVAPRWVLPALVAAKNASDWHCSSPIQMAVGEFIRDGHLAQQIRRVRRTYLDRRRHFAALIERKIRDKLTVPSFSGTHMTAIVDSCIDCDAVRDALAKRGVMIHSLQRYHLGAAERSGFVAMPPVDVTSLEAAIEALAEEVRRQTTIVARI